MSNVISEDDIERIMGKIGESLFPPLGKISGYDVCRQERLMFSETCRIELYFKECKKTIFLKKYHKEKRLKNDLELSAESEYNILRYLHEYFSSLKGINVIKPIAFLVEEDIIVTEEFVGDKLNALVVDRVRWVPSTRKKEQIQSHFFQCGRWLRYFQKFTKKDEVIPFRRDSYIENIEKRLYSSTKYSLKENLHNKMFLFINNKFKRIGDQKLDVVGYHSDFTPWNILVNDDEIRVMDFDQFSYKDRYDDLTLFLVALEDTKSIVGMIGKNIDGLKGAFLHGYDTKDMDPDIFQLYILKNTLKALSWVDIWHSANTNFIDVVYERYRKKRGFERYLRYVDNLTSMF